MSIKRNYKMYANNNVLHQTGHFLSPGSQGQMEHQNLSIDPYEGYGNEESGYNPVIVGISSQYGMDQAGNASLEKCGKEECEEILPTLRGKSSLSSAPSSVETHDLESDSEPEEKKKSEMGVKKRGSGRGGRHQDEIRTIYKFENGQWLCPNCNKAVSPRATRMKAHFEKCCSSNLLPSGGMSLGVKLGNPSSQMSFKRSREPSLDSSEESGLGGGRLKGGKKAKLGIERKIEGVGRQKSEVWQFYEERVEGQFFCKRCGKRVSSKAHRLSQHLVTACVDTPKYIASELRKSGLSSVTTSSVKSSSFDETRQQFDYREGQWCCVRCGKAVSSSLEKMKKHLELWCSVTGSLAGAVSFGSSTPAVSTKSTSVRSECGLINLQLGKFIYSSNLPFDVVEDPEFTTFVKMLRSNYKLPTPGDLGNSILKDVECEIQVEMQRNLEGKSVTLIQTGYSSILKSSKRNPPECHTIIHALHNGKCSYFLDATLISAEDITPAYCLKLITEAIDAASHLYSCNVVGILTDHCKTSTEFRGHIQRMHPNRHVYGCFLYLLNCLANEITDFELMTTIDKVQEYFASIKTSDVSGALRESEVFVANEKTWNNQSVSLTSFLANHCKYVEMAINLEFTIDEDVKAILQNQNIFTRAQELTCVLSPLSEAFSKLQNDTATIADAVNCWLTLMNDPQISDFHKEKIQMAFTEGVTPMAIAAYLLHPVYRGQNMLSELQEIGRMWLLERNPMFVVGQTALERADTTYFPSSFLNLVVAKQMAPAVWWENAGKWPAIPEGLMNLAISLMVLPASTSTVDQCSNTIGSIMSTHKQKLGLEKALNLCNAYFSLRRK